MAFVGEVERSWEAQSEDRHCGCGLELKECSVWARGSDERTAHRWLHSRRALVDLARVVAGKGPSTMARLYAAELGELYAELHTRLGVGGLVDTSKYLRSLVATALIRDAELVVVHVVRDARGALHSRARLRRRRLEAGVHPRPGLASQAPVLASVDAATWLASTALGPLLTRRLGARRLRVSYSSFCENPQGVLDRVASELGAPVNHNVDRSGAIELPPAHSAGGNADRFDSGLVTISEDTGWRSEPRGSERFVASATWWLFRAAVGTTAGFGWVRCRVHKGFASVKP